MKIAASRRRANEALSALITNVYFPHVPLDRLYGAVEGAGFEIPEDERPFLVCGHEGRAVVPLRHLDQTANQALEAASRLVGQSPPHVIPGSATLTFSWYRMPSGRFEVVAYVS
jgi:hypothetical protein